jgi:hypothetical protein
LAGGLCEFCANAGGKKQPIERQLLVVQYKQQASPLVISRNDKNKQLTLLRHRKLALTARNTLFEHKIIGAPKKFKICPFLYLGIKLTKSIS